MTPAPEQASAPHPIAGWRERVTLPEWGLKGVRAKLDTGARTSAIDVAQYEELPGDRVRFEVVGRHRPERRTKWVEAPIVRRSVVKPSHGERQERLVCLTPVRIGPIEAEIEIGLVCRKNMLCRMLLGRRALMGRVVVDPEHKYLLTSKRRTSVGPDGPGGGRP